MHGMRILLCVIDQFDCVTWLDSNSWAKSVLFDLDVRWRDGAVTMGLNVAAFLIVDGVGLRARGRYLAAFNTADRQLRRIRV